MKKIDLHNDPKINSGFSIPEGYFEQLEAKILKQLPEKEVKVISVWKRKTLWVSGIAAIFTVTLGIVFFQNNYNQETTTLTDFVAYEDVSTYEIAEHLTDNDIAEIEKNILEIDSETKNYIEENVY